MLVAPDENFSFYGAFVKKIFVRECYPMLLKALELNERDGVRTTALTGTPGVGKSLFAVYLVISIIKGWITVAGNITKLAFYQGVSTIYGKNRLFAFRLSEEGIWQRVADLSGYEPDLFINDISTSVR